MQLKFKLSLYKIFTQTNNNNIMKTKINITSKKYREAYSSYLGTSGTPTLRERDLANAWARKQTNQTI